MSDRPDRVRIRTGMARTAYDSAVRRAGKLLDSGRPVEVSALILGRATVDDAVLLLNDMAGRLVRTGTADEHRVMAREVLVLIRPDRVPARP